MEDYDLIKRQQEKNENDIENLKEKIDEILKDQKELKEDVKKLVGYFNQGKGGIKVAVWIVTLITTVTGLGIGIIKLFK